MDTGVGPDGDVDLEAWDAQSMGAVVFRFLDRQLCLNKNIKENQSRNQANKNLCIGLGLILQPNVGSQYKNHNRVVKGGPYSSVFTLLDGFISCLTYLTQTIDNRISLSSTNGDSPILY